MEDRRIVCAFPQNKAFLTGNNSRSKYTPHRDLYQPTLKQRKIFPLPTKGREHMDVQTELYLEELKEVVETDSIGCQTDPFIDRPPTPLFVPAKTGVDVSTDILANELFDFNLEAKPLLEILVGKTLEQSLLESQEEDDLRKIREEQLRYEEIRAADLLEMQRLEERERRYRAEKEHRIAQHKAETIRRTELAQKLAVQNFARNYMEPLVTNVFEQLYNEGYFYDVVQRGVEEGFLPWLMDQVGEELEFEKQARALLDCMIREAVDEITHEYSDYPRAEDGLGILETAAIEKNEKPSQKIATKATD